MAVLREEERVTPLELFFDLVFVLAITQCTALMAHEPTWEGLAAALLGVTLVPVFVIDLEHRLIPRRLVVPAAVLGLVAAIAARPERWWVPLVAAVGAFIFFYLLSLTGGMGDGDADLALLMGAVLGASVVPALFVAFGVGAVVGAAYLARFGSRARKMAVPFGPRATWSATFTLSSVAVTCGSTLAP